MTRYADADKLLALFSFDDGRIPIPLVKDSIKTYIVNNVAPIKYGYWINPHWKNSSYCYNCSVCNAEAMHSEYKWAEKGIYPFCPNCGAKMDG